MSRPSLPVKGQRSPERPGILLKKNRLSSRRSKPSGSALGDLASANPLPKPAPNYRKKRTSGAPAPTHFLSGQEGAGSDRACTPHRLRMRLLPGGSGAPRRADFARWLTVRLRGRWGLSTSASPPPDAPRGLRARRDHVHQHRLQWAL